MNRGAGNMDAIAILAFLIIAIIVLPKISPNFSINTTSTSTRPSVTTVGTTTRPPAPPTSPDSPYTRSISIGIGNATYTYQPYEEYITLSNNGQTPVDITGWKIKNGRGERSYDLGSNLQHFPSESATIPQGAHFISPYGNSTLQNIVLQPGDTAIITTGNVGSQLPYKITSFKENICSAYLENLPEYSFTPALTSSCPRPADEPGAVNLSSECRQFLERMPYCQTPEFNTRDREGNICTNCVNGTPLPNSCVAFIKSHFSYAGCIANHVANPNFSQRTWRVFLGRGWEMWATKYERIQVFDQQGLLVKEYSY